MKRQQVPPNVAKELRFLKDKCIWFSFLAHQARDEDNPLVDEFEKMLKEYQLKLTTVEKLWGKR